MWSSPFSQLPIQRLPCTPSVHVWHTPYWLWAIVTSIFFYMTIFFWPSWFSYSRSLSREVCDDVPLTSLNLWGTFFLNLSQKKIILTCSKRWVAAALAPVFFRYSDQSKLRFCQFSPTSLYRKENNNLRNYFKPQQNINYIRILPIGGIVTYW